MLMASFAQAGGGQFQVSQVENPTGCDPDKAITEELRDGTAGVHWGRTQWKVVRGGGKWKPSRAYRLSTRWLRATMQVWMRRHPRCRASAIMASQVRRPKP